MFGLILPGLSVSAPEPPKELDAIADVVLAYRPKPKSKPAKNGNVGRASWKRRAMDKGEWIKGVAHWTEGDVAMISVAFTWRLPEARKIATYYRAIGMTVRIGGPALFTKKARDYMLDYGDVISPVESSGRVQSPDAVFRHNPMATFASRGCPVGCSFCIVTPMEGAEFTEFDNFAVRPVAFTK